MNGNGEISYSNRVKNILSKKKTRKKCCKAAYGLGLLANDKKAETKETNWDVFLCHACKKSFFRGLFQSCGSLSDPASAYHLEFALFELEAAQKIKELAEAENIFLKYVRRRNKHVLYLKSSEQIEDFLYYIQAEKASFELMETKILKDIKNNANRITNFEGANLEKISKASANQIETIKYIIKKGAFGLLPDELKQTARLRLRHIDMSMGEIGEISNPPVSKSGIVHRMQKIFEIASELK